MQPQCGWIYTNISHNKYTYIHKKTAFWSEDCCLSYENNKRVHYYVYVQLTASICSHSEAYSITEYPFFQKN
jgi:hypothetical protein